MKTPTELVREEWTRFQAALPALLEGPLKDRWVVFKDGEVVSDFDALMGAYADGVRRFGRSGGQVVAKVEPITPRPLTAGALYLHR